MYFNREINVEVLIVLGFRFLFRDGFQSLFFEVVIYLSIIEFEIYRVGKI